jgi:hypothetical protein
MDDGFSEVIRDIVTGEDSTALGKWLSRNNGRITDGLRLEAGSAHPRERVKQWRVARVTEGKD